MSTLMIDTQQVQKNSDKQDIITKDKVVVRLKAENTPTLNS
jgi:hypothetical protein